MLINISAIKGEAGTGYEAENGKGEFECKNCHFYRPENSSCGQKEMVEKSKQPRTSDGRVKVDPEGCCEFVDRVGKVESREENMAEHNPEEKKHFARAMHKLHGGALHEHFGISADKPIPMEKKEEAARSSNKHVAAMGRMAVAMHGWKH
jgi:hypothetical protein